MTASPSPSPPPANHYVSDDDAVFTAQLFWFSLSAALLLCYLALLRWRPGVLFLRGPVIDGASVASILRILKRLLAQDERRLIEQCGLDAYLTLRLVRFCLGLLLSYAAVGLFVLSPLYYIQGANLTCKEYCASERSGNDDYHSECVCGVVDQCSMANVPKASHALWVTAVAICYNSAVTISFMRWEYKEIVRIRQAYFASRPPRLYTVFVDRIPRALATQATLVEYFERLFPGQIMRVEIVAAVEALKRVGEQRATTLRLAERALAERDMTGMPPRHWIFKPGCGGFERVDSVQYYVDELERLNREFKQLKQARDEDPGDGPRQAFVTFSRVTPAAFAAQALVHSELAVKAAPDPEDVRWNTLGLRNTAFSHFMRKVFSRVLFGMVVLFWGALTSLVGAVMSTEALAYQFPSLNDFLKSNPGFTAWLDRVTTLVYVAIIALVYPIIALSVKLEVRIAQSNVDRATSERYFLFLVVQVFVFYSIAGSVFKSVVDIAQNPSHIVSTLASTIPKNAAFFISFISVKVFWVFFDLLRGYNYIFSLLRFALFGRTVTQREWQTERCGCYDFSYPSPVNLAGANANILLVFFIATSYAAVQPLVLLVAVIYFASQHVALTLIYTTSSKQNYDGGGTTWTHNFWCVGGAMLTSQLTLVGTLLTKSAFAPALCVFGAAIVYLAFASLIQDKYRTAASDISVEICSKLDDGAEKPIELRPARIAYGSKVDAEEPLSGTDLPVAFQYQHPVLQEDDEEQLAMEGGYRLHV